MPAKKAAAPAGKKAAVRVGEKTAAPAKKTAPVKGAPQATITLKQIAVALAESHGLPKKQARRCWATW